MRSKPATPRTGRLRTARLYAATVATLAAATTLAACSSSGSPGTSSGESGGSGSGSGSGSSSVNASKVKLAFIYDTVGENFAEEMSYGAAAAAAATGIHLTNVAPPTPNGAQQVQQFQAALQTSKDGIALATLFPDLFVRPFMQAASDGVPAIAVDAPPAKGSGVKLFIGNDNYALGVQLANALLPKIPNKSGEIMIGTDTPGLPVLTARNKGFQDTVSKMRPSVKFINFNSTQEPASNFSAWSSAVQSHPDALAFVGPGGLDAASLAQIEKKTGKKLLVGADDLDPNAVAGVAQGYVEALVSPEHWLKGYLAINLLAEAKVHGKALPTGWWNPGSLVVDTSNIAQIQARQKSTASRAAYFKDEVARELADPSKYIKPLSALGN